MSGYDEMCNDWVQARKFELYDGTWCVCNPITGEPEDNRIFATEKDIDNHLWSVVPDQVATG